MNIGRLRHRVTIQQETESQDSDSGEVTLTWADYRTRWADIEPLKSSEVFVAMQTESRVTHHIIMRPDGLDAVDSRCRIVFGSRVFNIVGPPRDIHERGRLLVFDCMEVGT